MAAISVFRRLKRAIGGPRPPNWQDWTARHAVAPDRDGCARPSFGLIGADQRDRDMPIRLKKLIGTILLVALVVVYALIASAVAVTRLAEYGPTAHLLFFLLSGFLWVLPAMAIIKWLIIEPRPKG
jgi:hypothetical protein